MNGGPVPSRSRRLDPGGAGEPRRGLHVLLIMNARPACTEIPITPCSRQAWPCHLQWRLACAAAVFANAVYLHTVVTSLGCADRRTRDELPSTLKRTSKLLTSDMLLGLQVHGRWLRSCSHMSYLRPSARPLRWAISFQILDSCNRNCVCEEFHSIMYTCNVVMHRSSK